MSFIICNFYWLALGSPLPFLWDSHLQHSTNCYIYLSLGPRNVPGTNCLSWALLPTVAGSWTFIQYLSPGESRYIKIYWDWVCSGKHTEHKGESKETRVGGEKGRVLPSQCLQSDLSLWLAWQSQSKNSTIEIHRNVLQ